MGCYHGRMHPGSQQRPAPERKPGRNHKRKAVKDISIEQHTRDSAAGTDPSAGEAERRRLLAEQVADRIQRELTGDLELLRARLGLGPRITPGDGADG